MYISGMVTGYLLILASLTQFLFGQLFAHYKQNIHSNTGRIIILVGITVCVVYPLSLIKNLHGFRYIALVPLVCILYICCILLV